MRRSIRRVSAAVAAGAALGGLGATGAGAAGAVTQASRLAASSASVHPLAAPAARLWVQRYDGPGNGDDRAREVAASPDGSAVYVTGVSTGTSSGQDFATVAYNAASGARLWVARYNGPGNRDDEALSVAVSPDGKSVYVTGWSPGTTTGIDYATIAYSAATGDRLWVARYNGPGNSQDEALAVAVSPDGARVYVTGFSVGLTSENDYATVAYNALTGLQEWVARYNGPASFADDAVALAVSPRGRTVYVTGLSEESNFVADYATVAYSAAGDKLWVARYNGPGNGADDPRAVGVSPDGRTVYVTGQSDGLTSLPDYATIAYNATTGARLWLRRYAGVGGAGGIADSMSVSPAGTVFVTGVASGGAARGDYATIAYGASGTLLWVNRYNDAHNGNDRAWSVTAPGNGKVYVTGVSPGKTSRKDYATAAYNVFTGTQLWVRRYGGPVNGQDQANSVAARAGRVFVTGGSQGATSGQDYATVAYHG